MSPYLQRHCQHQVPGSKNCFLGTYKVATFSSPGFAAMVDEWSPAGRGRLTTTRRLYANRKTGGRGTTRSRHRGAAQTTPSTERRRGLQSTQLRGGERRASYTLLLLQAVPIPRPPLLRDGPPLVPQHARARPGRAANHEPARMQLCSHVSRSRRLQLRCWKPPANERAGAAGGGIRTVGERVCLTWLGGWPAGGSELSLVISRNNSRTSKFSGKLACSRRLVGDRDPRPHHETGSPGNARATARALILEP